MTGVDDIRQRSWDFGLTVVTVVLLASLGVQSFIGTLYVWWAENNIVGWQQTSYNAFVGTMNGIAAPQLVFLVVAMGLCVPKRLFARGPLLVVSAAMLLVGAVAFAWSRSLTTGLAVYLSLAATIQVAVVVMTAAGVRGPSYLTQGRLTKVGSGMLHLGFILFALVIAVMQRSSLMMPAFWVATAFTMGGTVLSFYSERLAYRGERL